MGRGGGENNYRNPTFIGALVLDTFWSIVMNKKIQNRPSSTQNEKIV